MVGNIKLTDSNSQTKLITYKVCYDILKSIFTVNKDNIIYLRLKMIELSTPLEIIKKAVELIENERKTQKLQQKELALKADIPLPTYKQFIYSHKISFENLIKLFMALRLFENLNGLLKTKEHKTLDEIKNADSLPKRIVK